MSRIHTGRSLISAAFSPAAALAAGASAVVAATIIVTDPSPHSSVTAPKFQSTSQSKQVGGWNHRDAKRARKQVGRKPKAGATAPGGPADATLVVKEGGHAGLPHRDDPVVQTQSSSSAYTDLNPFVRSYCDQLNTTVGSPDWLAWGCALYPGQTGGQPDFGWRQDHMIPKPWDPAYSKVTANILSNAGYRPVFYMDLPDGMRTGYGRPWGWIPDTPGDDPVTTGWIAPNGKVVMGHDAQHFSLKFLAALAGQQIITEPVIAAKVMMWRFSGQVGGVLRTDYFKQIHSSREVGRLCDFMVDCVNTSIIEDNDAETFLNWINATVLPSIQPNGIGFIYQPGDPEYKPEPNLGNVPYWFPWQDGLMAAGLDRLGKYLVANGSPDQKKFGMKIQVMARKVAINMASVITHDGAVPKAVGLDNKLSWVENEKYGYGVWCYRALRLANANAKAQAVFERYKDSPEWWSFFVEPDGNYTPGLNLQK